MDFRKDGLARQSSVYSLTFDEFQSTLGKDFGSMNMDELLRSIWSAEEVQATGITAPPAPSGPAATSGLQRQGSLTLPRTLSQKTVDEVWRNLVVHEAGAGSAAQVGCAAQVAAAASAASGLQQRRQPTLGEMTLEEFLVRAGVVREDMAPSQAQQVNNNSSNGNGVFYGELPGSNNASGLALGFAQMGQSNIGIAPNSMQSNTAVSNLGLSVANQSVMQCAGGMMGIGDSMANTGLMQGMVGLGGGGVTVAAVGSSPVNKLTSDVLAKSNGELSSVSPVPYMFNGGLRGKRAGGALEKVVERRQRRMIKNRESAARSRARKQAYTMELEAEVAKLKEQNQALQKRQQELMEMQKNQVLEMINKQYGPKRRCLRRTQTGPW